MSHLAENSVPLQLEYCVIQTGAELLEAGEDFNDVCVVVLPLPLEAGSWNSQIAPLVASLAEKLGSQAVLVALGEMADLVHVHAALPATWRYQQLIALKRTSPRLVDKRSLPHYHSGALIHTRYKQSLRHVKTRVAYSYCPTCDKTTKDYGGKKHTYHHYGTLLSDVWRDCACDLEGDLTPVLTRLQDFFGLEPYATLRVLDCRWMDSMAVGETNTPSSHENALTPRPLLPHAAEEEERRLPPQLRDCLLHGDCLEQLRAIPDNSIDFVFTDPPYNVGKQYHGYADDGDIQHYFAWCDQWLGELARVLKPGCTLALLNIPLWSIRHFLFLETVLCFQNWIAWDALSFPVRLIMPAHYTILAFSKGPARDLPGLVHAAGMTRSAGTPRVFDALRPLAEGFCLRASCVQQRTLWQIDDRGPLTDLWWDIHRLKHNSRRVDHPTQLPPQLLYRLLAVFTRPAELVLDCFNGSGTTTLAAAQLGRHYIGIEQAVDYFNLARMRHAELSEGLDPFRKVERTLTAKNSVVPRLAKQKYAVSKKLLQLDVKRIAGELGRLPTRDEVAQHSKYPITYYDHYFVSWGEVCAAARTSGMTEERQVNIDHGQ